MGVVVEVVEEVEVEVVAEVVVAVVAVVVVVAVVFCHPHGTPLVSKSRRGQLCEPHKQPKKDQTCLNKDPTNVPHRSV